METTCAVVRLSDGLVMNTIVASPSDPAPVGCELVEIMTGQINDNQTANWQPVDDSQTANWSPVNDGNTVVWTQIPT